MAEIATEQNDTGVDANRKTRIGKVVSNKADKTIVVSIERQVAHPIYKKYFKRTKKLMAHDEANDCNIGDLVKVIETRPLSARKRWRLVEIIKRAQ
ncbi:MAG: 30S ribosomal protein S17 [bacterium]|nr:30S ribosomal protein S17 [bacterium]